MVADQRYAAFEPMFGQCDLVIVEGDSQTIADKIEVWRASSENAPMSASEKNILAVVTDDDFEATSCQRFSRSPLNELVRWIVDRYLSE